MNPPNSLSFEGAHNKRRKSNATTTSAASNGSVPEIHIHFPAEVFSAVQKPTEGLQNSSDKLNTTNSSATDVEGNIEAPLPFPTISSILHKLHRNMPQHNFLQYKHALTQAGILYVNDITHMAFEEYTGTFQMPRSAAINLWNYRTTAIKELMGKGRAAAEQVMPLINDENEVLQ